VTVRARGEPPVRVLPQRRQVDSKLASSPEASVRQGLDVRSLPWTRRLVSDYLFDYDALSPFFAGNPASPDAWTRAIARTRAHRRDRDRLHRIAAAQLERRGAPAAAIESAAALRHPESVAIVTGQQAGLFGGPLYTLLKALHALRLADVIAREHGVRAVPVFWVEAEDHDWDEVRGCRVLDGEFAIREIAIDAPPGSAGWPVWRIGLDEQVVQAVDALERWLPPTEFTPALIADLRDAYRPGLGMADAFARWLDRVLGARGLLVFEGSDPAAKPLAAMLFARELETAGATAAAAARAGDELEARGYHAQVTPALDQPALFSVEGIRRPIRRDGDTYAAGDRRWSRQEIAGEALAHPERFSPNVLLRPLVQDTIFPTAAYVAGPNELAYLGQLAEVYERFGVPMPLMVPRMSATILDSAAARFLSRYGLPIDRLRPQDEAVLNELLEAALPGSVDEALQAASAAIADRMQAVIAAVPAVDPTLEGAARNTLGKMEHELRTLQSKVLQASKKRDEVLRRQFLRARALVFPGGDLQERALGFVYFLDRYGPALLDRLDADVPLDPGMHWVARI
jgi:bacillithiol biosynthesis cysteine-adding enzyme BshC